MNESLIPTPDSIPVHHAWFQVLLLFTFLLHVILMNFVLGGSLITLWDSFRGRSPGRESFTIPTLIALAINFGVPPLLFIQVLYGHFFYTSSVILAVPWILVIPVLILAYYGAYLFVIRERIKKPGGKAALLTSTVLLLLIAFVFVNNTTLSLVPARWGLYFNNPGGWNMNLGEPILWPRFLHIVTGAIAIAGLGKAAYFYFSRKTEPGLKKHETERGIRIFSYATMVQVLIGLWFLLSLPGEIMRLFLGQNMVYTLFMATGILTGLAVIILGTLKKTGLTLATTLFLLVIMIVIRDLVRKAYLGKVFSPSDLRLDPERSPFLLFLLVFVIGLASIYMMIKIAYKTNEPAS